MRLRAELIDTQAPVWASALARARHDFHHMPGYLAMSAELEDSKALGIYLERGDDWMLLPILVSPIPGTEYRDARSPYGYPSPLFSDPTRASDLLRAGWPLALRALDEAGIISLFVRTHPLLPAPWDVMAELGALVDHGQTVSLDLRLSDAEAWAGMRHTHKTEIRRAERDGLRAFCDETFRLLPAFERLYAATMERREADAYYRFPPSYFARLRDAIGPALHLWAVEIEGEVAAAALITEVAGLVEYHLSASSPKFAKVQPTKLLLEGVRRWAKARGDLDFHLGGGVGGNEDSLFFFKAGFSKRRHTFRTWRVVVAEPIYARLVRELTPAGANEAKPSSFFPLYRAR